MSGNVPTQVPEDKGSTRGALPLTFEVDGGNKQKAQYRLYTMTFSNGNTLAEFAVFNHKTSTNDANFDAGKVYWYVNTGYLGDLSSQNLSISFVDKPLGNRFSPPNTGQKFHREDGHDYQRISLVQPDPQANQGFLYRGTDNSGNTVCIRFVKRPGKSELMKIVWYQLISASAHPALVAPNGTFTRQTKTGGVTAPQGQSAYYYIENA
ncbi:hypothetical protein [Sorangium atrum]|uniref:Uncharacterized protein n=1 Tax=Sorangium atrum TaxID=2995308 RepID=A0ABT5BXW3_9BACT|nr:hypothetical protein [Sorangium aterium]MDC0678445.1 hypothetical protein [Sorangium aterium]